MNTQVMSATGEVQTNNIERDALITTLQNSLYTGAKRESVEMVLSYCEAARLDPMQKPVHLVPMSVKNPTSGQYEFRDVVMPGIGLYRIQASRSSGYAGITEPEFGEMVTETFVGENGYQETVTFPEWCRVTVKRQLPNGDIADFSAKEYWIENYATAGRKTEIPNSMWKKRKYGQLAKCAEAQALRKAFPEVGAAPTAEEMEGKELLNPTDSSKKSSVVHIGQSNKQDYSAQINEVAENVKKKNTVQELNDYFGTIEPNLVAKVKHLFSERKNEIKVQQPEGQQNAQ